MDIEFKEAVEQITGSAPGMANSYVTNMLRYAMASLSRPITDPGNVIYSKLLWLISNYISASCVSHQLTVLHVEHDCQISMESDMEILIDSLPTSITVHFFKNFQTFIQYNKEGKTVFESEILHSFSSSSEVDLREGRNILQNGSFGAIFVKYDTMDVSFEQQLEDILSRQKVTACVAMVHPAGHACQHMAFNASDWDHVLIEGDELKGYVADVYIYKMWDHVEHESFSNKHKPEMVQEGQVVTLVPMDQFPGMQVEQTFPAEDIAGAEAEIFTITEKREIMVSQVRHGSFLAPEKRLISLFDVNVSYTATIWRDGIALFESLFLLWHDLGKVHANTLSVPPPTTSVDGTCFLAPTGNRHHSHHLQETLKNLHYAERFQPNIQLLANDLLSPSQREYFPYFGFPPEKVIYRKSTETFHVKHLLFAPPIYAPPHVHQHDHLGIEYFRHIGLRYYDKNSRHPRKIYGIRSASYYNVNP